MMAGESAEVVVTDTESLASMRVLLWHVKTGRFFQGPGNWTARAEEALCFSNTIQAISRVVELKLDEVEILLAFDDPRYNIRLPLGKRRGDGRRVARDE